MVAVSYFVSRKYVQSSSVWSKYGTIEGGVVILSRRASRSNHYTHHSSSCFVLDVVGTKKHGKR